MDTGTKILIGAGAVAAVGGFILWRRSSSSSGKPVAVVPGLPTNAQEMEEARQACKSFVAAQMAGKDGPSFILNPLREALTLQCLRGKGYPV